MIIKPDAGNGVINMVDTVKVLQVIAKHQAKGIRMNKLLLYVIRWQLSSPILYFCMKFMVPTIDMIYATIISNLIGALIFFPVDKWIIRRK